MEKDIVEGAQSMLYIMHIILHIGLDSVYMFIFIVLGLYQDVIYIVTYYAVLTYILSIIYFM